MSDCRLAITKCRELKELLLGGCGLYEAEREEALQCLAIINALLLDEIDREEISGICQ